MKKNIKNNDLKQLKIGKKVTLYGWVSKRRKIGKLIFIDLRDMYGKIQLVFDSKLEKKPITKESVIEASGIVVKRKEANLELKTGNIEIKVEKIKILNESIVPPFVVSDVSLPKEENRLKYRYLDLRTTRMRDNIIARHNIIRVIREFLYSKDFLEIETPILSKATPEGARDFLVKTRLKDKFFALPQSPQIYKELLMGSGFEKYFQIARVFRDEDNRSDRQPEFTQLDMEMSFVEEDEIISLVEKLVKEIFKSIGIKIKIPFERIEYSKAIKKYKSDKPITNTKEKFNLVWVMNFPMYEKNKEGKLQAVHHPFTQESKKGLARSYDLILNGIEIGGGSIRNHKFEEQIKVFKKIGLTKKEIDDKFSFFLNAMKLGMPPHGGIALGIDRLIMILRNESTIREVIAFPKNSKGIASLENAPSKI